MSVYGYMEVAERDCMLSINRYMLARRQTTAGICTRGKKREWRENSERGREGVSERVVISSDKHRQTNK